MHKVFRPHFLKTYSLFNNSNISDTKLAPTGRARALGAKPGLWAALVLSGCKPKQNND